MFGYALLLYVIWMIVYDLHDWQECMNMELKVLWQCYMILNEYDMIDKNEQTLYELDEQQTWTKPTVEMFDMNM